MTSIDTGRQWDVTIPVGRVHVPAIVTIPTSPAGTVVFAHGSGSSRSSPRNRFVAHTLEREGFATLLADLLTEREADDRRNVFDIGLLAGRLQGLVDWVETHAMLAGKPVGYFGASTGAAAALVAAEHDPRIRAVVSRGGRPDLAGIALRGVTTPTLFIVGGADRVVLDLNRQALAQLSAPAELVVVPDATHLFEEPGALERVARLAADWFRRHLTR